MIRLTELKLPLEALPVEHRRAADAPTETEADRAPTPQPIDALKGLAAQALHIQPADIAELQVFKRSFDARKAQLPCWHTVQQKCPRQGMFRYLQALLAWGRWQPTRLRGQGLG